MSHGICQAPKQYAVLYHASLLWIVFRFFTTIPGGTSGSTKFFSHDARARPKRSGLTRLKELKRNDMVANPMNNRQNAVKQIDSSGHWWCCCVTRWAYRTLKSTSFQQLGGGIVGNWMSFCLFCLDVVLCAVPSSAWAKEKWWTIVSDWRRGKHSESCGTISNQAGSKQASRRAITTITASASQGRVLRLLCALLLSNRNYWNYLYDTTWATKEKRNSCVPLYWSFHRDPVVYQIIIPQNCV